jgi:hypothetical protein
MQMAAANWAERELLESTGQLLLAEEECVQNAHLKDL